MLGEVTGGPYIVTKGFRQSWDKNYSAAPAIAALAHRGHHPHVMLETGYGVTCASPRVSAYWGVPSYKEKNKSPQRVSAAAGRFGAACKNTKQNAGLSSFEYHLKARRLSSGEVKFNWR